MTDIQSELRILAGDLDWPVAPDLSAAVGGRLTVAPVRVRLVRRRLVLLVAALLVAAVASVLAVPSTRSAVLRVFGIGAIEVRVVDELPPPATDPVVAPLGDRVDLATARAALPGLLEPDGTLGPPDGVYLLRRPVILVTFVWKDADRITLLTGQLRGRVGKITAAKIGREVVFLDVDGNPALWIGGGRHHLVLERSDAQGFVTVQTVLARDTLVVDRGEITLRIEGDLTRAQAVAVSRRFR